VRDRLAAALKPLRNREMCRAEQNQASAAAEI